MYLGRSILAVTALLEENSIDLVSSITIEKQTPLRRLLRTKNSENPVAEAEGGTTMCNLCDLGKKRQDPIHKKKKKKKNKIKTTPGERDDALSNKTHF